MTKKTTKPTPEPDKAPSIPDRPRKVDVTCIVKKAFHSGGAIYLGDTANISLEDAEIMADREQIAEPGSASATKAEKEAAAQAEKAAQFKERRK